jgi:hypothetical protein
MAALDEIGDALEDVGHLAHHPQALLHEGEQLAVLLRCGALLGTTGNQLSILFIVIWVKIFNIL